MRKVSATLCSATLLLSLGAIATLASCGSPTAATPPPPTAPTVSVVANPATITQGNSSMLAVTASNATQVVISDNSDSSRFTLAVAGGTQKVTPTTTTTYTATATGPGGTATSKAIVTVTLNSTAPTVTIVANPTTVPLGSSSTLAVTASNATQVVISDNVDSTTYTLPGTGGTQPVSPTATTTYTATATGAGGMTTAAAATITVTSAPAPTVTINSTPTSITQGTSSTLTVTASNATQVVISNNVASTTYTLPGAGGTQPVSPASTTTYTATATGAGGTAAANTVITVHPAGSANSVNHVIFMMQENRSFDTYFGMLNPYRKTNGWNVGDDGNTYNVDGIDDKLTNANMANMDDEGATFSLFHTVSSCLDDMTSAWLESYGDVSRYDFSTNRPILMDGFVHTAENFARDGAGAGAGSPEGTFTDFTGQRAMAYYTDTAVSGAAELNY